MSARFDLEQKILRVWGIIDDLKMLNSLDADKDKYNALMEIYELHFQDLWNIFEKGYAESFGSHYDGCL